MIGPKGNSDFCFPRPSTLRVEGKQNSLFPDGGVINCFDTPLNSKIEKKNLIYFDAY